MELENDPNRAVDLETGDIYYWDWDLGQWVLDPKEVIVEKEVVIEYVTEYVPVVEDPSDSDEPSNIEASLYDLEAQVNDLEDEISLLSDEVSTLSDYNAAGDYNLGTTNQAIFSGLVSKVPFGQNYVYWRDGQYSYKFAYGDLTLEGSEFVSDGIVTICSYDTSGSSYNNYYTWSVFTDSNFSLSAGDRLVYSDLGDYPALGEREVQKYAAVTAYVLFGAVLFILLDRLRSSCFGNFRK